MKNSIYRRRFIGRTSKRVESGETKEEDALTRLKAQSSSNFKNQDGFTAVELSKD